MKRNDIVTAVAYDRNGYEVASLSRSGFANALDVIETLREMCLFPVYRFKVEFMKGQKRCVRFFTTTGRLCAEQSEDWLDKSPSINNKHK